MRSSIVLTSFIKRSFEFVCHCIHRSCLCNAASTLEIQMECPNIIDEQRELLLPRGNAARRRILELDVGDMQTVAVKVTD